MERWRRPGCADMANTDVITKDKSAGCWRVSLRFAVPG
jgi:hypothetical protein